MMKSVLKLLLLSPLFLALAAPATAQQKDWKKKWEKTLAAARAEGQLVVATSPNQIRRALLQKRWQKDYPDIKLNLTSVRGSTFLPKLATERKAGKFLWDVWQSGPGSGRRAAKKGYFDPLLPEFILPEVSDPAIWGGWQDAFFDDDRKYLLGTVGDVSSPYYNAKKVSPERIKAEGLKVMLDPQFKGKIVWYDPRRRGPGGNYLSLFDRELGKGGLKKLVVDQAPIFVNDFNKAAETFVRGKAVIVVAGRPEADLKSYIEAGIKMDVRRMGTGANVAYRSTAGSTLAVFTKRPHPNASRVFANWYASKAVQTDMSKATFFNSRRADVPPAVKGSGAIPGQDYVYPQRDGGLTNKLKKQVKKWRP